MIEDATSKLRPTPYPDLARESRERSKRTNSPEKRNTRSRTESKTRTPAKTQPPPSETPPKRRHTLAPEPPRKRQTPRRRATVSHQSQTLHLDKFMGSQTHTHELAQLKAESDKMML